MPVTDKRVDEQIAGAPAFAQPVLRHLRALVHQACPEVEETIKWGRPFFLYRRKMLFYMAAFKGHCGFGFVGPDMRKVMGESGMPIEDSAGSIGRITAVSELPPRVQMLAWMRQAVAFAGGDEPKKVASKVRKPELEMPADLFAALKKTKGAKANFEGFSPSCRREYIEWITEAKRAETRERRVAQAAEWVAEGKTRNWKYMSC